MNTLLNPKTWAMTLVALAPTGVYYLVTSTIFGGETHELIQFLAAGAQLLSAVIWASIVLERIEHE